MKLDRQLAVKFVKGCGKNNAPCSICRKQRDLMAMAVLVAISECAAVAGQTAARLLDSREGQHIAQAIERAILRRGTGTKRK